MKLYCWGKNYYFLILTQQLTINLNTIKEHGYGIKRENIIDSLKKNYFCTKKWKIKNKNILNSLSYIN